MQELENVTVENLKYAIKQTSAKISENFRKKTDSYTKEEVDEKFNTIESGVNKIDKTSIITTLDENSEDTQVPSAKTVYTELNKVFQSVSNGKSSIETAITDKGGTVSKENDIATFEELCNGVSSIQSGSSRVEYPMAMRNKWYTGFKGITTYRCNLTSSVVNGMIYCIGGYGCGYDSVNATYLNIVERYNPPTNNWIACANMPTKRSDLTSQVINGLIYCIGGYNATYLNIVECYNPSTNNWIACANMPTARYNLTSSVVDGLIYCIGGIGNITLQNTVECYNPSTDTWSTCANMPTARYGLTSSVVNGLIYCIAGYGSNTKKVECYNPSTDTWTTCKSMSATRYDLTSSVVDGLIYCIGGSDGSKLNTVECYNPSTDTWSTCASMPTARYDLTSSVVDGLIYCIAGYGSTYLNTVECYIA